jgi:hypothetical protein
MPHNDHASALGAASGIATLNGGSTVVQNPASASATPGAAVIPIADGSGQLAAGFGGAASTLATLNGSTQVVERLAYEGAASGVATLSAGSLVVENPANASATPGAAVIPIADGSGQLAAGFGGAASTLATLNASSLVVEDPASTALPKWTKYTVAATAFTAAAAAEDVELLVLPARGVVQKVVLKHTTAFSGGTSSALTLSVGITGTLTKYSAAFDVFQTTGDTVFSFNELAGMEDFGATTSIRVEATATGDTLDNVGTGSCDIWVLTSALTA